MWTSPLLTSLAELVRQRTGNEPPVQDAVPGGHRQQLKVEVSGLDFWYGDNQVLFDVSVAIPQRAVTALIGPSGCGKSTFLRTLNRRES